MKGIIKGITPEERLKQLEEKNKNLQDNFIKIKAELEEKNKILAANLKTIENKSKEKKTLQDNLKKIKNDLLKINFP